MKKFLFLLSLVAVFVLAGCAIIPSFTKPGNEQGVCTKEAKICPDGSAVGREGPNCEFASCPTLNDQYGCKTEDDCRISCAWGGVNKEWYEKTGAAGDCQDGCASIGLVDADLKCISGVCHMSKNGKVIDDSCSQRDDAFKASLSEVLGIANPASTNCKDKGGRLVIQRRGDGGEYGLCFFDDNRACEEWAMMLGDCPVGGVKTTGFDTEAQRYCAWSGGSTLAVNNATCVFKDGSQCLAEDFYNGVCKKGNKSDAAVAIKDLFVKKYDKKVDEVTVTINQEDASHARGGVKFGVGGVGEGGIFLAAKVNGVWQLVFDGNGGIYCDLVKPYNFPAEMIGDCYKTNK